MSSETAASGSQPDAHCLARSVLAEFSANPGLEAVTIDREKRRISVATIGRVDVPRLTERISSTVEQAQLRHEGGSCGLLEGSGDCSQCPRVLPDVVTGKMTVRHEDDRTTIARVTCPTAPSFWRWRDIPLPKVLPRRVEIPEDEHGINEWKAQLAAAGACGASALFAWLMRSQEMVSVSAYALAYVAGAWFAAGEVWERLQKGVLDVHFLMLAVAAGSAAIGAWGEGATLLFLFSFSGALEHYAFGRTQREIRSLFRNAPKTGIVLDGSGGEREVPVEQVVPGMRLLVKPGAQFPVDAEVVKGSTASDESNLTGEAVPVEKSIGDTVLAGTMNLWGAVEVLATRGAGESSLQKVIRLIREAQTQKAPAQQFADRFSGYYTYGALGMTLLMFLVWWLGLGLPAFKVHQGNESAFYRAMTLLVVASPCALVLSIPSAVLAAIAWGARHGVLFRGGSAVEKLAGITTVVLDKTGTLTTGELKVESVESFPPGREGEIARLACSAERLSSHPLARAMTHYGKQQQLPMFEVERFESLTGLGIKAVCQGKELLVGNRAWISAATGTHFPVPAHNPDAARAEIWVRTPDLIGRVTLRDDIRPRSRMVLDALRAEGLRTVMLTGDHHAAAERVRTSLHLDEVRAEFKPDDKLNEIRRRTRQGEIVAMVGDGVNDAPSLAAAHVGVAMGARGSDAALEQADVVLMHDRIENFLAAFRLSQRARKVIRQNLVISLGTVVVLVSFALVGGIPLTVGVVGHEGSTVLVVMNSLRLLFGRGISHASPAETATS